MRVWVENGLDQELEECPSPAHFAISRIDLVVDTRHRSVSDPDVYRSSCKICWPWRSHLIGSAPSYPVIFSLGYGSWA